jgi:hypothetical protein
MKRGGTSDSSDNKKRLACSDLTRRSYVSQSALARICKDIKAHNLPSAFSRASQHRARKAISKDFLVWKDVEMTVKNGTKNIKVGFLNPFTYLQHVSEHSDAYARVLLNALSTHPPSFSRPWSIIVYQDGVDPGDGLKKEKSRHCAVFYWSVLEFGPDPLSHEEFWATGTVVRTHIAKQLTHGLSELTYKLLETFHTSTRDMRVHGCPIVIGGQTFRIFMNTKIFLADTPALAEMIHSKGQGG